MIVRAIPEFDGAKDYKVIIKQGHQQFTLDYHGASKSECQWLAKMFRRALIAHNAEVLDRVMLTLEKSAKTK